MRGEVAIGGGRRRRGRREGKGASIGQRGGGLLGREREVGGRGKEQAKIMGLCLRRRGRGAGGWRR